MNTCGTDMEAMRYVIDDISGRLKMLVEPEWRYKHNPRIFWNVWWFSFGEGHVIDREFPLVFIPHYNSLV